MKKQPDFKLVTIVLAVLCIVLSITIISLNMQLSNMKSKVRRADALELQLEEEVIIAQELKNALMDADREIARLGMSKDNLEGKLREALIILEPAFDEAQSE